MLDERDEGVLADGRYETWLSVRTIRQEEKGRHVGGICRSWHFSAFWRAVRQLAESAGRIQAAVALRTREGGRAIDEYFWLQIADPRTNELHKGRKEHPTFLYAGIWPPCKGVRPPA
jgi:hypothetical protein